MGESAHITLHTNPALFLEDENISQKKIGLRGTGSFAIPLSTTEADF
jgi:hypothetical protein